jgi:hypothetical protein
MIQYYISHFKCTTKTETLFDRRDNVCVCGDDMLVLDGSDYFDEVSGFGGHCKNQLRTVT